MTHVCVLGIVISAGGEFVRPPNPLCASLWISLLIVRLFCAVTAKAQGPSPEVAPTLFPGGGLVSYNSIFVTRGLLPGSNPAPSRPTFSHEGDFIFTWGFHRDFHLTVLLPVLTNHFDATRQGGSAVGGTGLGDAMVLVKYRFYRRDSKRGTTQTSVTLGPKCGKRQKRIARWPRDPWRQRGFV